MTLGQLQRKYFYSIAERSVKSVTIHFINPFEANVLCFYINVMLDWTSGIGSIRKLVERTAGGQGMNLHQGPGVEPLVGGWGQSPPEIKVLTKLYFFMEMPA